MMYARSLGGMVALTLVAVLSAGAQEADSLSQVAAQSLDTLVARLPGRPVSMETLVRVAMDRNLDLQAARLTRELAEADVERLGGDFDPSVRFSGSFATDPLNPDFSSSSYTAGLSKTLGLGTELGLDLVTSRSEALASVTGFPVTHDTDLALSLKQPLLDGFNKRNSDLRSARAFRDAARYSYQRGRETVMAQIENLYWALAEAEAVEAVRLRSFEIAQSLAFRNQELNERDLVARVDVLTAQSGVEIRRAHLVDARRVRRDAAEDLVFAAYGEDAPRRLAEDSLPIKTMGVDLQVPDLPELDRAQAQALDERSDLKAAQRELAGVQIEEGATANALLPDLNLEGSLRTAGRAATASTAFDEISKDMSWSVGLSFSAPLGNRADRGRHLSAQKQTQLRSVDLASTSNEVRQDVRRAVRAVRFGQERNEAASRSAELAAAELQAERQRLELGLGDSFRLLQIEENAVQADLVSVQARFDLARAVTDYRLATGALDGTY